jgi:hypothetical protein
MTYGRSQRTLMISKMGVNYLAFHRDHNLMLLLNCLFLSLIIQLALDTFCLTLRSLLPYSLFIIPTFAIFFIKFNGKWNNILSTCSFLKFKQMFKCVCEDFPFTPYLYFNFYFTLLIFFQILPIFFIFYRFYLSITDAVIIPI